MLLQQQFKVVDIQAFPRAVFSKKDSVNMPEDQPSIDTDDTLQHNKNCNQAAQLSGSAALHILTELCTRLPLSLTPGVWLGGAARWRGARDR